MESLTDDLWAIILARLPLKSNTASKLVCKQWKSVIESLFFRDVFLSMHQNSPTCSWSLMCNSCIRPEVVDYYRCNTWGLERSLGSYIKSFLTKFEKYQSARVAAFSDAGLILIKVLPTWGDLISLYVVNPVSRQCVEIFLDSLPKIFRMHFSRFGLATRTEKGVLLGYKVVVYDDWPVKKDELSFWIYSSETGLWSFQTFPLPSPNSFDRDSFRYPAISLNGNLHWYARSEAVLSIDFFATSPSSDRYRVTPFPDLGKSPVLRKACTTCQGLLMYMDILSVTNGDDKLCIWRLQNEGWQLVSEISPAFILTDCFDYCPLILNPFDVTMAYIWSMKLNRLIAINLHNGEFVLQNHLEDSKYDGTMISIEDPNNMPFLLDIEFSSFVLPQWLHQIPTVFVQTNQSLETK